MTNQPANNYLVEELNKEKIAEIKEQWSDLNAPADYIYTLILWEAANRCSCLSVKDGEDILAVFDIREAPAHIKTMKVMFSPQFDFQAEGEDSEKVDEAFTRLVAVLLKIFFHVVDLSNRWGTVKIYSDIPEVGILFVYFAKRLHEAVPSYKIKIYNKSKWVEIINSNASA